ncbi:uncharacterized protein JCM10292_003376 [Rhodotorula paludigena]|uniref:uncharacterized protein n=1 Tax=Rhodotorula paludigena TaxID=86838 RepID=UPI003178281D
MDSFEPYAGQYAVPHEHQHYQQHHQQPHCPVASTSQLPPPVVPPPPPLPPHAWTAQIPLEAVQIPPGASVLLPPAQAAIGQLPDQLVGGTQLVKVTAKSCSNCRTRKVKCDRKYPECTRCTKRKEECDYGDDVSIALRPTWVTSLEDDIGSASGLAQRTPLAGPAGLNRTSHSSSPYPYPPPQVPVRYDPQQTMRNISDIQHRQALIRSGQHSRPGVSGYDDDDDESSQSFAKLWETFLRASNLGASSSDWRLALPTMASSLTIHLIDASMHSCCFHLPAFHIFSPDVQFFKEHVDSLDLASQVIVGILTSLGARASPHSALLGVAGPDIENGKASLDLVLSAGIRRENAWRAIVKRATDLCSKMEILQVPSARNAQTLVAFVQMLMLAEVKPKTARFFLRSAMGLFRDMQHSDLPPSEVQAIKSSVGPTLFESDARIAAYLSMPVVISDNDLYEYFEGTGVHVPDLANEDLGPYLDEILDPARGLVTRAKLDRALGLTGYFVCAVQRAFSNISSSRRPSTRFLKTVPELWSYVDRAHAAVQKLHRRLVQLDYTPAGCDAHHSVDYDLLIGVRMDERLLDIVHLAHVWLIQQRRMDLTIEDRAALEDLLATSERRVRKCLKLLAFYSKVFVDSLDKHVVYHLVTQLEALPGWATMIAQREGEPTEFGPLPAECALTDVELDWFTRALELACFFTPLGHERLLELRAARAARQRQDAPYMAFGDYELSTTAPGSTARAFQNSPQGYQTMQLPPQQHQSQQGMGQASFAPPRQAHAPDAHFIPSPLHDDPALAGRRPRRSSATWQFDSYGTPLGVVDTPSSASSGSDGAGGISSYDGLNLPTPAASLPGMPPLGQPYSMPPPGTGAPPVSMSGADFLPLPIPPQTPVGGGAASHTSTPLQHHASITIPLHPAGSLAAPGSNGSSPAVSPNAPPHSSIPPTPGWRDPAHPQQPQQPSPGYDYVAMLSAAEAARSDTPAGSVPPTGARRLSDEAAHAPPLPGQDVHGRVDGVTGGGVGAGATADSRVWTAYNGGW